MSRSNDWIDLKTACALLGISTATGRNWVRNKTLMPVKHGRPLLFERDKVQALSRAIASGRTGKLKRRRNKRQATGSGFLPQNYIRDRQTRKVIGQIADQYAASNQPYNALNIILLEYALKLLRAQSMLPADDGEHVLSVGFINGSFDHLPFTMLLKDLLGDKHITTNQIHDLHDLLSYDLPYGQEDVLGLLYMALRCIGKRKRSGMYFTPHHVVTASIQTLDGTVGTATTLFDPCCGSGNFLIESYRVFGNADRLYGQDIDPISISLCRLNMLLLTKTADMDMLYKNFTCANTLTHPPHATYDVWMGNPPWGYAFNPREQAALAQHYTLFNDSGRAESFALFVEAALTHTRPRGTCCYVLPHAVTTVRTHQKLRRYMTNHADIRHIQVWGNIFDKVHCPAITLTLSKQRDRHTSVVIQQKNDTMHVSSDRFQQHAYWNVTLSDADYDLLQKIERTPKAVTLRDKATFALGIVTGDNDRHLRDQQTDETEPILSGTDLQKFSVGKATRHIHFQPDLLQQVAPVHLYRAPEKLLYRFICKSLVFAYDDQQRLSLNSANILIPHLDGLSIKYVLAVLNSSVLQYYHQHAHDSVKILRTHIERLPIPTADLNIQREVVRLVDALMETKQPSRSKSLYDQLDQLIFGLYRLSSQERMHIHHALKDQNTYL